MQYRPNYITILGKKDLEYHIAALNDALIMEADIRATIESCKHWKKVDAKFINALKEKGYYASLTKQTWGSKELKVGKWSYNCGYPNEFKKEFWGIFYEERKAVTWENILIELEKHKWAEYKAECEHKISNYDEEIRILKNYLGVIKNFKLNNFSNVIEAFEDVLKEAIKA